MLSLASTSFASCAFSAADSFIEWSASAFCNASLPIAAGDAWLKANLPPIITYALAHNGYVFVTWDEGNSTNLIPFIAIGNHSKVKYPGAVTYTHSSLNKSVAEIFGVTPLSTVASANDFADLFDQGTFP